MLACRGPVIPLLMAAALLLGTRSRAADTLLLHGHIYTANPGNPWAQALSVSGAHVDGVGSDRQILALRRAHTRVIDLKGRTVIPGIFDSHLHLLFGAMELHGFNLSTPEHSLTPAQADALVASVKAYADSHPGERILIGRADFSTAPPSAPTLALLDRAVSERPVVIHNMTEHALWLNSQALALAGITDQPVADPEEERNVIRDASGRPSGVLLEAAQELMERAIMKQLSAQQTLALLRSAEQYLNGLGITSVVNATGDLREIELYAALRDRGELTLRTRTAFGAVAVPHKLTAQLLDDLDTARSRYHDEWVSANLVKFFADGSTGLIPPLVYDPADFRALVLELDRRGYQLMTHAERGDSVHMILDAYENAIRINGPRDRRLRIEHDFVVNDVDVPRFAQLSVIASAQPLFCCSQIGTNYDPQDPTPTDRWHSLLASGAAVVFGSDWPCAWPPDPFVNVQQAVTRQIWHSADTAYIESLPLDGAQQAGAVATGETYVPQERITVRDAIDAYTRSAAYAAFAEDHVGSLAPGMDADLVILSQDVFSVDAQDISKTHALLTMVGGKIVFEATP
jgi:predicted amidohydrolase YtcJ